MLPVLACALLGQIPPQVEAPQRLRTLLPNGAAMIVERVPNSPYLSTQLILGAEGARETPATHGLRHLLEHLCARGDGTLDRRLESQGAFLSARTYRDATVYEVRSANGDLALALDALSEVMRFPEVDAKGLQREAEIMEHEARLQEAETDEAAALWRSALPTTGLDPYGDPDVLRRATPEALRTLYRAQLRGANLVISIAGDIDVLETTRRARAVFEVLPEGAPPAPEPQETARPATTPTGGRGVPVPGFREPFTAWALAAGLALAGEHDLGYLVYTPSARPGLVVIGTRAASVDWSQERARRGDAELFRRGRILVRRWLARHLSTASASALIRGLLLVQSPSLRPEMLEEHIATMQFAEFQRALDAFTKPTP